MGSDGQHRHHRNRHHLAHAFQRRLRCSLHGVVRRHFASQQRVGHFHNGRDVYGRRRRLSGVLRCNGCCMTRPVPDCAVALIKRFEFYIGRVYDDAHPKKILEPGAHVDGTLTAGWGHTKGPLVIGMTVTQPIASAWLLSCLLYTSPSPRD